MNYGQSIEGLSSHDLANLIGISFRQIDFWVTKGYLPSVQSMGSGNYRRWELSDVVRLSKIAALVQIGFLPERAIALLDAEVQP